MSKKFLTNIDLNKNELQNAVVQPLASAPSSPVEGQIYYNTTDDTVYVRANGSWLDLGIQGGAGATNLGATLSATNVIVTSDTGTDATIPAVDGTNAGVMTPTMKTKLDGIASGATANQTDAYLLSRANHTGTQSADTIVDGSTNHVFTAADDTKLTGIEALADVTDATNVDAAGAVMNTDTSTAAMQFVVDEDNMASNSATKVPTQQSVKAYIDAAVVGLLDFKGSTDASANPNYPAASKGDTYVVSVAGKIGGASGKTVEVGDMYVATADNAGGAEASVGTSWTVLEHNLVGALLASNNLSDVANAATAFGNIKQDATTSATGVVELATQAEAQAKTDTTRALTAASVADFARKVTGTIGNGSLTDLPVTHGLGTQWATAQVYEVATGAQVECDIVVTSSTVVTFSFTVAPTTNQYRYVIVG